MITYSISPFPGMSWYLFADEYTGFSASEDVLPDVAVVLKEVNQVFIEAFDEETVKSHPVLSVIFCSDGPVTYRKHALIFLSSRGRYYQNHVYQFAHELCHFMVSGGTCPEYQWLNEVFCHTMSWYAMHRIAQTPKSAPGKVLKSLYSGLDWYIVDSMRERLDLHDVPISEFIRQKWDYLRKNAENRPINDAIAYEIYPLFCDYPKLWKIVPFLDQLESDMTLNDAIVTLCNHANIPSDVLQLLAQRLC